MTGKETTTNIFGKHQTIYGRVIPIEEFVDIEVKDFRKKSADLEKSLLIKFENKFKNVIVLGTNKTEDGHFRVRYACPRCHMIRGADLPTACDSRVTFCCCEKMTDKETIVYVAVMSGNGERFIKVGKTIDLLRRLMNLSSEGYEVESHTPFKMKEFEANREERVTLGKFKKYKYYPKLSFDGRTECLQIEYKQDILDFLEHRMSLIS